MPAATTAAAIPTPTSASVMTTGSSRWTEASGFDTRPRYRDDGGTLPLGLNHLGQGDAMQPLWPKSIRVTRTHAQPARWKPGLPIAR